MNKLNVLIVPSWYPTAENPNNGIHFEQQIESLERKGLNTGIVLPPVIISLRKNSLKNFIKYFEKPNIAVNNYNGNKIYKISINGLTRFTWLYQIYYKRASKIIFKKYLSENPKPDIIHAHSALMGGIFSYFIKKKFKVPYIITEHLTHYNADTFPVRLISLIKKAFKFADSRIMVSPQLGKSLEDKLGVKNIKPWVWIPNLIPDSYFETHKQKKDKKRNSKFRFLNIGMMELDDRKGHKVLLQAFAEKFSNNDNAELVIIGDGPFRKSLENMVSELKINKQVLFKGLISNKDVADEISKCDACVIASNFETFGVVAIEALACGKPVVATESGGPESIITKNNGLLVPKSNPDLLGEAMVKIKNNIGDYDSETLQDDCYKNFSGTVVAEKIIDIYNKSLVNI